MKGKNPKKQLKKAAAFFLELFISFWALLLSAAAGGALRKAFRSKSPKKLKSYLLKKASNHAFLQYSIPSQEGANGVPSAPHHGDGLSSPQVRHSFRD
jgi:hypothetical protein